VALTKKEKAVLILTFAFLLLPLLCAYATARSATARKGVSCLSCLGLSKGWFVLRVTCAFDALLP